GHAQRPGRRPARRARRQSRSDLQVGVPMTATLLKHEWLRTRSMLGAIAGIAVVLAALGSLLAATRWPLISTIGAYAVTVTIAGLVPAVQLALAADYWRSSYGRTGYFTQTLPVSGPTIFR